MKQGFYPVRDADNPSRVHLEPVSEEVYRAVYPDIWRTQKQMRKLGQCVCPRRCLWACDGDCALCSYAAPGKQLPLEAKPGETGAAVVEAFPADAASVEEIIEDMDILDALHDELSRLDPEWRAICKAKGQGVSEREAARILGMNDTTFRRHWQKIREMLCRRLKERL